MNQVESEYGEFQDNTSWYAHAGQGEAGELVYLTLGLVGEAGEFADNIKKIVRESGVVSVDAFDRAYNKRGEVTVRDKLIDELGDVFWYLNKLLRFLDVDQEELMVRNTYKLYSRLANRTHANLMELEWPFTDGNSFEEVQERYTLLKDKEYDGVR